MAILKAGTNEINFTDVPHPFAKENGSRHLQRNRNGRSSRDSTDTKKVEVGAPFGYGERGLIFVLFEVKFASQRQSAGPVVGKDSGHPQIRRRRCLVIL